MSDDITDPDIVLRRLAEIERDMATRQNVYESAARNWVRAARDQKKNHAIQFRLAKETASTVAERHAVADEQTILDGASEEAEYTALRVVMSTLSERGSILQSVLRAQQIR